MKHTKNCGRVEHCCYLGTGRGICPHLVDDKKKGRQWWCGLLVQYGTWDAVHESPEYLQTVKPFYDERGDGPCGNWPAPGEVCQACGDVG
jgi:hypothetical protein